MKQYIRLVKKWFWLVILGALIAGGGSYVMAKRQIPMYDSTAVMAVGGYQGQNDPDLGEIRTAIELALYYSVAAETTENLQAVIDTLGLDYSTSYLDSMIEISSMVDVPILHITVVNEDSQEAADIANAMAQQMIINSPTNLSPAEQAQLDQNLEQIDILNAQIRDANTRIDELDVQIAELDPNEDADILAGLRSERTTVVNQLNATVQNVTSFNADNTRIRSRINILRILEPAVPSRNPSDLRTTSQSVLGAMAGAGLAIAVIVLLEYANTSIRTSEEAVRALGIPVLGTIARFGGKKGNDESRLISQKSPSIVLEGYRTLQANLLFTSQEDTLKGVYLVTSPNDSEGKSTTAANLAITMAMSGLRVLLIDADMHKPKLHEIFKLDNSNGLATMLSYSSDGGMPQGVSVNAMSTALTKNVQSTSVQNLRVITSGTANNDMTGNLMHVSSGVFLLSHFNTWLELFRQSKDIDIVIFDTPPTLASVDSSVLAATSEADVILVIEVGKTRREEAQRAKGQFVHVGREVRGVVLNKTPRSEVDHGYGYGYYEDLQTLNTRPSGLLQPELQTQQVRAANTNTN